MVIYNEQVTINSKRHCIKIYAAVACCLFAVNFSFAKIIYNVYFQKGLKQIEAAQNDEAIKSFSLFIANDSSKAVAFYNRGIAYKNSGQLAAAVHDFNKALQLDVSDSSASKQLSATLFQLAMKSYETGDTSDALKHFAAYVELNPQDDIGWFNYGVIQSAKNEKQKAIENYSKAIEINKLPVYYSARAIDYFSMKNYDACLPDVNTVLNTEPNDTTALWMRAQIFYVRENLEGCQNDLEQLLKIVPENADAKTLLSDVSVKLFIKNNWYYAAIAAALMLIALVLGIFSVLKKKSAEN
jgi:tetratricopeptide (TPR) repeat protein